MGDIRESELGFSFLDTSLILGGQASPFYDFLFCYVHMEAGVMSLIFSAGALWQLEFTEHQPLGAPAERLARPSLEPRTAWGLSSQIIGQALRPTPCAWAPP